jgi:hypothetical protein
LLLELAAKIYEFEKYKGIQFRLKDMTTPPTFEFHVINHFYVKNMSVFRSENSSLKYLKMVPTLKNVVEYVPKIGGEIDNLDISVLETLEKMKKLY